MASSCWLEAGLTTSLPAVAAMPVAVAVTVEGDSDSAAASGTAVGAVSSAVADSDWSGPGSSFAIADSADTAVVSVLRASLSDTTAVATLPRRLPVLFAASVPLPAAVKGCCGMPHLPLGFVPASIPTSASRTSSAVLAEPSASVLKPADVGSLAASADVVLLLSLAAALLLECDVSSPSACDMNPTSSSAF